MQETGIVPLRPDENISAQLDEGLNEASDLSDSFEDNERRPDELISLLIRRISNDLFQNPRFARVEGLNNRENQSNHEEPRRENTFLRYFEAIRNESMARYENLRHLRLSENPESITSKIITEADLEDDCKICGESFQVSEEAKLLECSHCFHSECLGPWLKIKNSCPTCRNPID